MTCVHPMVSTGGDHCKACGGWRPKSKAYFRLLESLDVGARKDWHEEYETVRFGLYRLVKHFIMSDAKGSNMKVHEIQKLLALVSQEAIREFELASGDETVSVKITDW